MFFYLVKLKEFKRWNKMTSTEPMELNHLLQSNVIRQESLSGPVRLDLEITPRSDKAGLKGYNPWRQRIIVGVQAPRQKGQANAELMKMLSKILNITQKQLNIIKGARSTNKTLEIRGLSREQVINRIFEGFDG